MVDSPKPVGMGVHLFGGGFARGMIDAGFHVPVSLEDSTYAEATFRHNLPNVELVQSIPKWITTARDLKPDVQFANAACACWSVLGRSLKHGKDSWWSHPDLRQTITHAALGLAIQPTIWVTESVPQFETRGAAAALGSEFFRAGYDVSLVRHDAKFLGLPQQRRRVFLVAHKVAIDWEAPQFTGMVPVGMALEGVPYRPEEGQEHYPEFEPLLDRTPPGKSLADALREPEFADWDARRPRFLEHRVAWDEVTSTLAGHSAYYHPFENRKLTWREFAAICGYPPDWEIPSGVTTGEAYAHLAKAVLPPVAQWLGGQLLRALDEAKPREHRATLATFWSTTRRINFDMKDEVGDWETRYDPRMYDLIMRTRQEWGW